MILKRTISFCLKRSVFFGIVVSIALSGSMSTAQNLLTQIADMELDSQALLMPSNATYGRAINGVSFQTMPLLTHGGYQYATWYHYRPTNEDVYLARRSLTGNTWEVMDTGSRMTNGDGPAWNAHNVISMGISGDGRIHFAWDHHNNTLRYRTSTTGAATGATWNASILGAERNSLNIGGSAIADVTYPRFINKPNGDMLATYRTGSSGNGNVLIGTYSSQTGTWDNPHIFIQGNGAGAGIYSDALGSSTDRNAYLNGMNVGADGRLHTTFTWRESAGGANHDIMYISSNDGGSTWQNNQGTTVTSVNGAVNLNSAGIIVAPMDRRQTLMNQQAQAVDQFGGVHALMWHRRFDEPGFEWQSGDAPFYTNDAAYYHYFRDPVSGDWTRAQLPTTENVSSRPKIGFDAKGDLFAVYVSPDQIPTTGISYYADGNLIIAGATRASGYSDWSILLEDNRIFAGEPFLDQDRLFNEGILSIFAQQSSTLTTATGTSLRVIEFQITSVPEPSSFFVLSAMFLLFLTRRRGSPGPLNCLVK